MYYDLRLKYEKKSGEKYVLLGSDQLGYFRITCNPSVT